MSFAPENGDVMSEERVVLKDLVTIDDVEVIAETGKALLIFDGEHQEWVPRSQIGRASEVQEKGDKGSILIPEWLAKEKGFI
jgi:hypothetical protein